MQSANRPGKHLPNSFFIGVFEDIKDAHTHSTILTFPKRIPPISIPTKHLTFTPYIISQHTYTHTRLDINTHTDTHAGTRSLAPHEALKERYSGEFGIVYEEWEQPDLADAEGWRCLCVSLCV